MQCQIPAHDHEHASCAFSLTSVSAGSIVTEHITAQHRLGALRQPCLTMGGVGPNGVQMPLSLALRRSAITHTSLPGLFAILFQKLMQASALCHTSMIAHVFIDGIWSDMLVQANLFVLCAAYS